MFRAGLLFAPGALDPTADFLHVVVVLVELVEEDGQGFPKVGTGGGLPALGMVDGADNPVAICERGMVRAEVLLFNLDGPLHKSAGRGEIALGLRIVARLDRPPAT